MAVKITKRQIIKQVLEGKPAPYIPWSCGFTIEAKLKLMHYFGASDIEEKLDNHLLKLGSDIGFFEEIGSNRVRDVFGAVWDRSIDKDIGIVIGSVLPERYYTIMSSLIPWISDFSKIFL
jgi:uroporphyrinogen decarboxylase